MSTCSSVNQNLSILYNIFSLFSPSHFRLAPFSQLRANCSLGQDETSMAALDEPRQGQIGLKRVKIGLRLLWVWFWFWLLVDVVGLIVGVVWISGWWFSDGFVGLWVSGFVSGLSMEELGFWWCVLIVEKQWLGWESMLLRVINDVFEGLWSCGWVGLWLVCQWRRWVLFVCKWGGELGKLRKKEEKKSDGEEREHNNNK